MKVCHTSTWEAETKKSSEFTTDGEASQHMQGSLSDSVSKKLGG